MLNKKECKLRSSATQEIKIALQLPVTYGVSFLRISAVFRTALLLSPQTYKFVGGLRLYFPDKMPEYLVSSGASFLSFPVYCLRM